MCGTPIGASHGHVADLEAQRLLCACRPCHLLFTGSGAGGGRFRALPETVRRVEGIAISAGQWDDLQIPRAWTAYVAKLNTGARPSSCSNSSCESTS